MGNGRRAVAGVLGLTMLLLSMTAGAEEATPGEAPAAETESASGGQEEAGLLPVPGANIEPGQTEWSPNGEAWAELADGTKTDGRLQSVLERAVQSPGATVYLLVPDALEVRNIDIRALEHVRLTVDQERFPGGASRYEVLVEEHGEKLTVQAVRIVQPEDGPNEGENPGEANPGEENPGEATPSEPQEPTEPPVVTPMPTPAPENRPTPKPTLSPETTPGPTASPTPRPEMHLTVTAENYEPDRWMTTVPTFRLGGIRKGDPYVYGVFICNERLILLDEDADSYSPDEQGQLSLRFAVLDMMGDIVAISRQYDMLIDTQPPAGPLLLPVDWSPLAASIWVEDLESGLEAISFDYGSTWEPYVQTEEGYTLTGRKGEIIDEWQIAVRDFAGNVSHNAEGFIFGESEGGGGGGGGSGRQPVRHVRETMDYSRANYNALELSFPEEPVSELTAGGTTLALTLTGEQGGEPTQESFCARLMTWKQNDEDTGDTPNALVLEAQRSEGANVWSFSGDVYKLLYNSGVDYLVLRSGEYIAALPTEGFTGGTQYGKLKAGGVSTRKFVYTLLQDEELRETTLSVTVEGETYLLEEDTAQPMYRYNVLVGPAGLMNRPYESYSAEKDDEDEIYEK